MMPRPQLATRGVEHASPDGHDEASLLRDGQIVTDRDGAQQRVAPPQERLHRHDGSGTELDDGLVLKPEVVPLDRTFELRA